MKLFLDDVRIRKDDGNGLLIDGSIYFSVNGTYFPSYQWFDLISVDLENWIPNLLSFGEGRTDCCTLVFMDGPYRLKLVRQSTSCVTASFWQDHKEILPPAEIDFPEFLMSVAKCARTLGTSIYEQDTQMKFKAEISDLGTLSKKLAMLAKVQI